MSELKETIINLVKHFNRQFNKKEQKNLKRKQFKAQEKTVITPAIKTETKPEDKKVTTFKYVCHHGNVPMTQLGNAKLYAGGWTRGASSKNCAVIDLTGTEYRWGSTNSVCAENKAADADFKRTLESLYTHKADESLAWLSMPIRDYGVPSWDRKTWICLAIDIFDLLHKGTDVLIACTGGHGRTGMALAIILYLMAVIDKDVNPVNYIRKNYCGECIETSAQENYVYKILGLNYTADAKMYASYSSSYNRDYWYGEKDYGLRKFDWCSVCGSYKWTTDGICDTCADDIDREIEKVDVDKKPIITGTCPYCGDTDVELTDHNGDMICDECQDWSKVRTKEIEKKYKGTALCAYCGDTVENPILYYNADLICERCYVDLFGSGLISEIVTDEDRKEKYIRLTDKKLEKGEQN